MQRTAVLRYIVFLLLPSLLLGCTRMKVTGLSDQPLPRLQHWTEVQVYQDIGDVPGAYREIAALEIASAVTQEKMLNDIQRRAARLGANGIVLEHVGRHTEQTPIYTETVYYLINDERWDGRALAIHVD